MLFHQEKFSKEALIEQAKRNIENLPNIITVMRISIALAILIFYLFIPNTNATIKFNPILLYMWEGVYSLFIIFMLWVPTKDIEEENKWWLISVNMIDVIMMVILAITSGGMASGFSILVLPFVAAICFQVNNRQALFYAAATTLTLFSGIIIDSLIHEDIDISSILLQVSILSLVSFSVSIFSSMSAINTSRTIHAMQETEIQIAKLNELNKLVLEHANEGLIVFDYNGMVILFNQKASHYIPSIQQQETLPELGNILTNWQNNVYLPFDDKSLIGGMEFMIHATPLTEQNPPNLMISLRSYEDVAKETQANKLASLGQLTANLAHEIRNPLSAISHANELLQENNIDDVDEHLKIIIEHNVERINKMIREILSLNKRDRINRRVIHIRQYLKSLLTEFMVAHPESVNCIKVKIECTDENTIFMDEDHLQQILDNLMNNAWKYSQKNSDAIKVSVIPLPATGEVVISIGDNGEGVPEEIQDRIFEPFYTTSQEGTGLGLYVARELAQVNNGILRYRNDNKSFELILKME